MFATIDRAVTSPLPGYFAGNRVECFRISGKEQGQPGTKNAQGEAADVLSC